MVDSGMTRSRVASEVLELGQALFDTLIEGAARHANTALGGPDDPYPVEELRAAAETFFAAVRLLLGLPADSPAVDA